MDLKYFIILIVVLSYYKTATLSKIRNSAVGSSRRTGTNEPIGPPRVKSREDIAQSITPQFGPRSLRSKRHSCLRGLPGRTGPQGIRGPPGPQGLRGFPGPKGDRGDVKLGPLEFKWT